MEKRGEIIGKLKGVQPMKDTTTANDEMETVVQRKNSCKMSGTQPQTT